MHKAKVKKRAGVLLDHKKVGKRLIPPMLQLPNLIETSFRDEKLPELIWLSAIFNHLNDRDAVEKAIGFIVACHEALPETTIPALAFLSNWDSLTGLEKGIILQDKKCLAYLPFLSQALSHQIRLLRNHPLRFLIPNPAEMSNSDAVQRLTEDVRNLLDRYCHFATKVQVTALMSMCASGKLFIAKGINMPDPNSIFLAPDSDEAKKMASMARSMLNAGGNMDVVALAKMRWANEFWIQSYHLKGCC